MKEAAAQSKIRGEKGISAQAVKIVTEVRHLFYYSSTQVHASARPEASFYTELSTL